MKTVRSRFVLIFIFFVATSILLDWSDHSYKNVLDKFEDVSPFCRKENKEFAFFKVIDKNKYSIPSTSSQIAFIKSDFVHQHFIPFYCKVKSFLHLLQLF